MAEAQQSEAIDDDQLMPSLRDALRASGMREAAEIARTYRPQAACECGTYLSFHNGVPAHLPGCLVGECADVAAEIEARAEELECGPKGGG